LKEKAQRILFILSAETKGEALVMRRVYMVIISVLLIASVIGNVLQYMHSDSKTEQRNIPNTIEFSNANSRNTYFTVHNIAEAHKISKGKGIKVGVIDWNFAYEDNRDLYYNAVEFTDYDSNLTISGHGKWMAAVLKEIAPECEIYALAVGVEPSTNSYDESVLLNAVVKAIEWSVENKLDILTLSFVAFSESSQAKLNEAVNEAVKQGVVTTFLHNDNANNIFPYGLVNYAEFKDNYNRDPDINIYQYDYNAIQLDYYMSFLESGPAKSLDDIMNGYYIPFYSNSSMSPVTAGFVAILKGVNNTLSPAEYKEILVKTSYSTHFDGGFADFEDADVEHVADIGAAAKYIQENYK
jgi:hypothetical protein